MYDRSGPHLTNFPTDMLYDQRAPECTGHRGGLSRSVRADIADVSAFYREQKRPAITGPAGIFHLITPTAIDGIRPHHHHRMFGPREAHTPEGMTADSLRREYVFDCAEDNGIRALDRPYHRAAGVHFIAQARYRGIPIT